MNYKADLKPYQYHAEEVYGSEIIEIKDCVVDYSIVLDEKDWGWRHISIMVQAVSFDLCYTVPDTDESLTERFKLSQNSEWTIRNDIDIVDRGVCPGECEIDFKDKIITVR